MQNMDATGGPLVLHDLNLLRMLQAIQRTSSVTRSGELLGLSQPAASRVLAKLRKELDDPLLIRTRKGYVLTPLAQSLIPMVEQAMAAADRVFMARSFDAAHVQRSFSIATTDYGVATVLTPLMRWLSKQAPGITLQISPWRDDTLRAMEQGGMELALYSDEEIPLDFHYRNLFREEYVVLSRRGHDVTAMATDNRQLLLEKLADYRHLVARYPLERDYVNDDILERLGVTDYQTVMAVPYFNTAPMLVAESDMIMLLPSRIARQFERVLNIDVTPIPGGAEPFDYRLIWHTRVHQDAGISWLRGVLAQLWSDEADVER